MTPAREVPFDFKAEGKRPLTGKRMVVEGNTIDVDSGVAHRILEEGKGCVKINGAVWHTGNYRPSMPVKYEIITEGDIPEIVSIVEIIFSRIKLYKFVEDKPAQQDAPPDAAEAGSLQQAIEAASEAAQETYPSLPSEDQLKQLAGIIQKAREEGMQEGIEKGYEKALPEIEGLKYDAKGRDGRISELEGILGQKEKECGKLKGLYDSLAKEHESGMKSMEEMCEGYRKIIKDNDKCAAELKEEISGLKDQVSEIKRSGKQHKKEGVELEKRIKELQDELGLLNTEKEGYVEALDETDGQMKGLLREKEQLQKEYDTLEDRRRDEISGLNEKIEIYRKEKKAQEGWHSQRYGLVMSALGLKEDASLEECMKKIAEMKSHNVPAEEDEIPKKSLAGSVQPAAVKEGYAPKSATAALAEHEEGKRQSGILQKAAEYVIVSMYITKRGDVETTLDMISDIITRFEIIDPSKVGLSEKDVKILSEYYRNNYLGPAAENGGDPNMLVGNFIDDIRPVLNNPCLIDGASRIHIKRELQDFYDAYNPKNGK